MAAHLFITGVPCTGKTLLGRWLAAERGWLHIDAEHWPDYDSVGIHAAWDDFFRTGRATNFIRAVDRTGRRMVFNWGFPMRELFLVPGFQAEGVETWWLAGDTNHARKAYIAREQQKPVQNRGSVEIFDAQVQEIERHWLLIERLFGDHIINGLQADGSQRQAAELWKELVARDERLRD